MSPRSNVLANFGAMLAGDGGASLLEYALILSLVSIVALAALRSLGNRAANSLNNAANQLS
jgi:Flp pilus assembly pilin Flp